MPGVVAPPTLTGLSIIMRWSATAAPTSSRSTAIKTAIAALNREREKQEEEEDEEMEAEDEEEEEEEVILYDILVRFVRCLRETV